MPTRIELPVGQDVWPLTADPAKLVAVKRSPVPVPAGTPRELAKAACDKPFGFEPLRRALTPDDRIAVVLDDRLPHLGELVAGLMDHLVAGGVNPEHVTLVSPPGATDNAWVDDLPDEYADVRTETHDPTDRKKLAYLATTKSGRRVYLNRTLVEADFPIVLSGRRYTPGFGYAGAEVAVFPTLSDEEARATVRGEATLDAPPDSPPKEPAEVAWLLGTPFFLQVIEGAHGTIQDVIGGLPDSTVEGIRRQDARWRGSLDERPDTVIAAISGPADKVTFADVATAAVTAARVIDGNGRIVVLAPAVPTEGDALELLKRAEDADTALMALAQVKPAGLATAAAWATIAGRAHLYLSGCESDDAAEELFATAVSSAAEVQRLIDAAARLLIIPDAHRTLLTTTA